MKRILAIIPACEGEAFPNKNVRVINNKPLIWYIINNAIKCKYVTDIVVTTNSEVICTIARQMGADYILRDPDLCGLTVPLEKVVADVLKKYDKNDFERIVVMQSISPALKVETLDNAFEKAFAENCDTMISVANRRGFYWQDGEGEPKYITGVRCNKYLLPPLYAETGAFLIFNPKFQNENGYIGGKVSLYPLIGPEALDVISFGDLKQVESSMSPQKIAFFVNGNGIIGLGHISRVLQIADELFTKPDIYFDANKTELKAFGFTRHNLIAVNGEDEFIEKVADIGYDVVINDILSTSFEYMSKLKSVAKNTRIINFEDEGAGARLADEVISALYEETEYDNVNVGAKYYVVPKLFLIYEPISVKDKVENVLVTFGGADPKGYTEEVLDIIKNNDFKNVNFYVIIGSANKSIGKFKNDSYPANVKMLYNIDNMPEIMSKCDIAVTSRGRTCYELAVMGIPTITMAQNEREQIHNFMKEENGFAYLGIDPTRQLLESELKKYITMTKSQRENLQRLLLKHDLRHGRKNVLELINKTF